MPYTEMSISFVMPVYNEAPTVMGMINEIIETMQYVRKYELIVVESNSTDGTRSLIEEAASLGKVIAIYENRPMGKGHAVRAGLAAAKNEIVVIFDGDREYKASDILKLIKPIEIGTTRFVLGSRYQPGIPMRNFGKSKIRSTLLNIVHKVFAFMCNRLFSVSLKDPFTMYKVFLREDISDLVFVENGFAFDVELVAKLIRSGHKPIEIPISYVSRGFSEGKKIRFFRDGYRLPLALIRHRWSTLNS